MFTGIVQGLCEVVAIERLNDLQRITIDLDGHVDALALGASVAVNGTCLTVTRVEGAQVSFDVIRQTTDTTNLGRLQQGDRVNVERSFKVGDEVGGHIVSGHISTVAELIELKVDGHDRRLTFSVPELWLNRIMDKGFVALDGASLTVSALDRQHQQFSVNLIPETINRTTLGSLAEGDTVNVEVDAQTASIVDTVERVLAERQIA